MHLGEEMPLPMQMQLRKLLFGRLGRVLAWQRECSLNPRDLNRFSDCKFEMVFPKIQDLRVATANRQDPRCDCDRHRGSQTLGDEV